MKTKNKEQDRYWNVSYVGKEKRMNCNGNKGFKEMDICVTV